MSLITDVPTITIDSNTHIYDGGSLYVIEQEGLDVLSHVQWTAVDVEDASFSRAMRADYILVHDRNVGVLVPKRTAHAWYRTGVGRSLDKFGNTLLTVPVRSLVERHTAAATLVNINYRAAPTKRQFPPLPPVPVSDATLTRTANKVAFKIEQKWFDIDFNDPGTMEEQERNAIAAFNSLSIEDKLRYLETGHDSLHYYAIRRSFIAEHERPN